MSHQESLFDKAADATRPLAARMRPETLDEVVGQEHLISEGKILRRMIESDQVPSMIFWGPPRSRQDDAGPGDRPSDPRLLHRFLRSDQRH